MRGFTLLELTVVIAIIAILAGIGLPQYFGVMRRVRESEGWMFLTAIRASELRYYSERDEVFTANLAELDIDDPNLAGTPLFTYDIIGVGAGTFTGRAIPDAACTGCRTLTLDEAGTRVP